VICRDELGPVAAKSDPGQALVRPAPAAGAERARQEVDDGRRGKGSVFGAFRPATGEAFTAPSAGRTTANWVACLERVEAWVPPEAARVYAVLDNLGLPRALDVLRFALAYPRWAFVFQPTDAADLTLIEPWGTGLRSLALKGRRFESWAEVCQAVAAATGSWNRHRHPFVWGRRRRHRARRRTGLAQMPLAA
jgi:hypothetical protein